MKREPTYRASPRELRLIAELTARSVSERLDAGEAEIVDDDDWSDVPVFKGPKAVLLPQRLYDKLVAASRRRRTTPDRLATRLLDRGLARSRT